MKMDQMKALLRISLELNEKRVDLLNAQRKINNPKIQVCSGCNLPLLMEIILSKDYAENTDILIDRAIENSKQSLTKLVL